MVRRDGGNVIGCFLIDIIIEPVAEQQIGVPTPADDGRFRGIVPGVVVAGDLHVHALCDIAVIFALQRVAVIFRVPGHKDLSSPLGKDEIGARLRRSSDDAQGGVFFDLGIGEGGMPGMRRIE